MRIGDLLYCAYDSSEIPYTIITDNYSSANNGLLSEECTALYTARVLSWNFSSHLAPVHIISSNCDRTEYLRIVLFQDGW